MKAIRTQYHGPTDRRGSRISATSGEKGQRVYLSDWGSLTTSGGHAMAAKRLCEKMGWPTDLIGGGFPDGSMVWVFAKSPDRTARWFIVEIEARLQGSLGVSSEKRTYPCEAVDHSHAREMAITYAHKCGLEHVRVLAAVEQKQ